MTDFTENPQVLAPLGNQKLPNATGVLVLGILSIPACCFWGSGLVFGIIALALSAKDLRLYRENPAAYDPASYKNLKAGRICAIIGISICALLIVYIVFILTLYGTEIFTNPQKFLEQMREGRH